LGYIIDISHHQDPAKMDYDKLAAQLDLVIIRIQYGSKTIDKYYKTHHTEFQKRGVPRNAYAWVRGINYKDMEVEATDFFNRTKEFEPIVWWLDIEEQSMQDMRGGIKAYVSKLRELGCKKVGAYIAHHLYEKFNIDTNDFDAIWIPRYGPNNGQMHNMKPAYKCDLWQYTSKGRLDGYNGDLDLSVLTGTKPLSFFIGNEVPNMNKEVQNNEPSSWAKDDWNWGIENGITDGSNPQGLATREQVVAMIRRAKEVK
jgi:GH25 family lysozyme M1 (1,4-beta-N-acetylmuramidase)